MRTLLNLLLSTGITIGFALTASAQGKKSSFDYQQFDWNKAYQSQSFSSYYNNKSNIDLEKVKGSPYFSTAFVPGQVEYKKEVSKNFYLRYNAYSDEIEVKDEPNTVEYQALLKTPDISATLLGETYEYVPMFIGENGSRNEGYLIVVHQGEKYTVYVQKRKEFREGREARTSFESGFPDKFVDEVNYFVAEGDKTPVHFKPSKKSLQEYAGSKGQKGLKKFMKDQDLDPEEAKDLAMIFQYFETQK